MKTQTRFLSTIAIAAALIVAVVELASCSARRGEPFRGPFETSDPRVERGRVHFARHCSKCHPGGEGGLAPAINDKPLPGFLMKLQSRVGFGAMPSIPEHELSSEDLDAVIRYLKFMRHR
jgi:mono/diheme cytochrome c family protein